MVMRKGTIMIERRQRQSNGGNSLSLSNGMCVTETDKLEYGRVSGRAGDRERGTPHPVINMCNKQHTTFACNKHAEQSVIVLTLLFIYL